MDVYQYVSNCNSKLVFRYLILKKDFASLKTGKVITSLN